MSILLKKKIKALQDMIMSLKISICVAKNTVSWAAAKLLWWAGQYRYYIENQGATTQQSQREVGSHRDLGLTLMWWPKGLLCVLMSLSHCYYLFLLTVKQQSFLTPHKGRSLKQAPNPFQRFWRHFWFLFPLHYLPWFEQLSTSAPSILKCISNCFSFLAGMLQ